MKGKKNAINYTPKAVHHDFRDKFNSFFAFKFALMAL